ncbi:HBL119Cp [Eremothecium sinecaudum]|uniref:HBL119Cp n=1 Tax=Eremothecium sinecaudum TaxID=45286 RepID=A0A109UWC7_9SACH|nr:HBL119Cp [Eremothecium sinecaudum]AMD18783.1 HBL119Cp [Eremothecium sinecaudum]
MSTSNPREAAKRLIKILERFPDERIRHLISFKDSQLQRFKAMAGLDTSDISSNKPKKPTLAEIKDIMSRTSAPLGLQKDMMKKLNATIPKDNLSSEELQIQINAMQNILNNTYKKKYHVGDKLYKPAGNPIYYQRLLDEIEGKSKENLWTAIRTVVFGK